MLLPPLRGDVLADRRREARLYFTRVASPFRISQTSFANAPDVVGFFAAAAAFRSPCHGWTASMASAKRLRIWRPTWASDILRQITTRFRLRCHSGDFAECILEHSKANSKYVLALQDPQLVSHAYKACLLYNVHTIIMLPPPLRTLRSSRCLRNPVIRSHALGRLGLNFSQRRQRWISYG